MLIDDDHSDGKSCMLTVAYHLKTESVYGNNNAQTYSRLLIRCSAEKNTDGLAAQLRNRGLECSTPSKDELTALRECGKFDRDFINNDPEISFIEIHVNVKLFESHRNPLTSGYNINQTLEIILKEFSDHNIQLEKNFKDLIKEGFEVKKRIAAGIIEAYGRPQPINHFTDFSLLIKKLNNDDDILPVMDQFGEFEDCEKIMDTLSRHIKIKEKLNPASPKYQRKLPAADSGNKTPLDKTKSKIVSSRPALPILPTVPHPAMKSVAQRVALGIFILLSIGFIAAAAIPPLSAGGIAVLAVLGSITLMVGIVAGIMRPSTGKNNQYESNEKDPAFSSHHVSIHSRLKSRPSVTHTVEKSVNNENKHGDEAFLLNKTDKSLTDKKDHVHQNHTPRSRS